jgi:uncharacterized membrane protein (DUF106 family)
MAMGKAIIGLLLLAVIVTVLIHRLRKLFMDTS